MAGFLKVLLRNVLQGPSTDPFPLGETFTPKRFRGKVVLDPAKCMGCGICRHTCAAGAIHIQSRADQSGYDFTVWHNSCCLCASCRHYCPTKAITLSDDWHNAHEQSEKFQWIEQHFVPYVQCAGCGTAMRPLPMETAKKIYVQFSDEEVQAMIKLCPNCRRMADAQRNAPPVVEGAEGEAAAAPVEIKPVAKAEVKAESAKLDVKDAAKEAVKVEAVTPEVKPEPKPVVEAVVEPKVEATVEAAPAKPEPVAAPKAEPAAEPKVTLEVKPAEKLAAPAAKPAAKSKKAKKKN